MQERSSDHPNKPRHHLTTTEIETTGGELLKELQEHHLISPDLTTELAGDLSTLESFAEEETIIRDKDEQIAQLRSQLSSRNLLFNGAKRYARRSALVLIPSLAVAAGLLVGGKVAYDTWFSDEAKKRAADAVATQLAKEKKARDEIERTTPLLGFEPSTLSASGWQTHYPKIEPTLPLTVVKRTLDANNKILIPRTGLFSHDEFTNIAVSPFDRSDGKSVDLLTIGLDSVEDSQSGNYISTRFEHHFLRDEPGSPDMDIRFLVVENSKEKYYVTINRKGIPWSYEIIVWVRK